MVQWLSLIFVIATGSCWGQGAWGETILFLACYVHVTVQFYLLAVYVGAGLPCER